METMQPNSPYGAAAPPPAQPHDYEFITNPGQPPRRSFNPLPGSTSTPIRVAIVTGGLLALLIVFLILKGIFSGGGNTEALVNVGQNQQQLIHLAKNANQQPGLSGANQAFAVTTQVTLTSAQQQLVTYLAKNGKKVDAKLLNLKVSAPLDEQLKTSAASSTYNATFKQTMETQLKSYQQALRTAYSQTSGPKGRELLSKQFDASSLLLQQLAEPSV